LDGAAATTAEGFPACAGAVKLERGEGDYRWYGWRSCMRRWLIEGGGGDWKDAATTDTADGILFVTLRHGDLEAAVTL
jgi:hypothetical protein